MNWTNLWHRLHGRPRRMEQELDEELAFHHEMKQRNLVGQGMRPLEAEQEARRSMGNLTLAREEAREAWGFPWLSDFLHDVRFGARTLLAQPGFTMAATLALVLGIGVNGILFTVYNAVALTPWAIRDAARTVQISTEDVRGKWRGFSWPEFAYLRKHTRSMDAIAAVMQNGVRLRTGDQSWNANAVYSSENFFDMMGTGFAAGRGFSPEAGDFLHPAPEIVLQFDVWQDRFGGSPDVVNQWLEVNGQPMRVVGIAAQGFAGPSSTVPQLWLPGAWLEKLNPGTYQTQSPDHCCIHVFGHLTPAVTREQSQAELETLSAQFRKSVERDSGRLLLSRPSLLANPGIDRRAKQIFLLIAVATGLILLLACANVANLQLARAQARRREIAVRLSLGAGRGRILRQLLAESVLLASLAGAITLALTNALPRIVMLWVAPSEDRLSFRFEADWRVAAFLTGASFAAALFFGLAPALSAIRDAVAAGLRDGCRTTSGNRMRMGFLAIQVALCASLLGGSALLLRAMHQSGSLDPGFQWRSMLVVSPNLTTSGLNDAEAALLLQRLIATVEQLPGVESVAASTVIPFGNGYTATSISSPDRKEGLVSIFSKVSAAYFRTLRIPLRAGREFTLADESRNDIAIINEALAAALLPGQSPVGKRFDILGRREIIGVVGNTGVKELTVNPELCFYIPSRGDRGARLLVRHSGEAAPLVSALPKVARELDSRNFTTVIGMDENVNRARHGARIAAAIAGWLSLLSLVLACVGIYGVAAYHVSQRTREIGVRIALGARPEQIVRMVLRQNLGAVAFGAGAGLAGALGFGQLLHSLLYGLSPFDPAALLGALTLLSLSALFAAWPNARRAARIEPAAALRQD